MKIEMIIEKIKNSYKGDNIDNSKTRDQFYMERQIQSVQE